MDSENKRSIRRPQGSSSGASGRKINRNSATGDTSGSSTRSTSSPRSGGANSRTGAPRSTKVARSSASSRSGSAARSGKVSRNGGSAPRSGPDRISATPRRGTTQNPEPRQTTGANRGQPPARRPKKQKHIALRILGGLAKFAAACICLGVMAGSVLAVLLSMYVVKITANDAELLDLTNLKLAQTTLEYIEYASFHDENNREWTNIQQIEQSSYLKWAFICVEDNTFYENMGVNVKRTVAAAVNEVSRRVGMPLFSSRQGASTITQQLIKNISGDDETDIGRKVREIFRAIGLNNRYDKNTILEAYMNTVSLTGTIAGVQAGAQEYFGVQNLADLSPAECASIAAVTKNPTGYNPYTNPEAHLARRNWILLLMNRQDKLSDSAYEEAIAQPLSLVEAKEQDVVTKTSRNSYFTDAVYTTLARQLVSEKGYTDAEARNLIYNGGLRIYGTVNPFIQSEMEKLMLNANDETYKAYWRDQEYVLPEGLDLSTVEDVVLNEDGSYKTEERKDGKTYYFRKVRIQAAMVTMNYEGEVLALVGGLGEKTSDLVLNRALLDGPGQSPRQTGSTMKAFGAYALGIDSGLINYSTNLVDGPVGKILIDRYAASHPKLKEKLMDLDAPEVLANPEMFRDWPSNYVTSTGHGERSVNVDYAVAQSLNTIAMQVGMLVGKEYIYSFVKDTLGLSHLLEADADYAPIVLGSQAGGINMVELAGAYQMFGNGGEYVTPHLYTRVEYATTGEVILDNTINITHTQAIQPSSAMIMNKLLQGVVGPSGTAGTSIRPAGDMAAAAKTGTTSDNKDYTFVGLTPYYVSSIWWGYDMPYDMTKMGVKNGKPMQKAWKAFMDTIQADLEFKAFPVSEDVVTASFCTASGDLAGANCPGRATGYYTQDNMPNGHCIMHP